VVVTATVAPTPLSRTTAPVTVIFREQIATQQATSVTELLLQVPGVHIDQARARGGISSVYGRGSDPNFTVVLIDGVKVNDPTNSRGGSFDFSTLSTDNIERIEIVRDPLSAVYGSDALGGVIPHIGVWYTLEATLVTFRMNAGEGFKLPSFFALGHPLVGNPSLLPETSRSVDAGVSQALWNQRYTRAC